jgi:hypothetical protein
MAFSSHDDTPPECGWQGALPPTDRVIQAAGLIERELEDLVVRQALFGTDWLVRKRLAGKDTQQQLISSEDVEAVGDCIVDEWELRIGLRDIISRSLPAEEPPAIGPAASAHPANERASECIVEALMVIAKGYAAKRESKIVLEGSEGEVDGLLASRLAEAEHNGIASAPAPLLDPWKWLLAGLTALAGEIARGTRDDARYGRRELRGRLKNMMKAVRVLQRQPVSRSMQSGLNDLISCADRAAQSIPREQGRAKYYPGITAGGCPRFC